MKLRFLFSLMLASVAIAAEPAKPEAQLREARVFAFGGIGIAGITSAGEVAWGAILKEKDAAVRLLETFEGATPEGKFYVLAGVREYDPKMFAECVAKIQSQLPVQVHTMSGCLSSSVAGDAMVSAVKAGNYRDQIVKLQNNSFRFEVRR